MANEAAWNQGWNLGAGYAQDRFAHKQALSDEQHAIKRDELLKAKDSLTSQLANYKDANGNLIPEMKDQNDKTMAALAQNQYEFGQLYDPIKAPGKLQQDWHYLREKIHGIKHPQPPSSTTTQAPAYSLPTAPPAPFTTPELPAYQQTTPRLPSQGGSTTATVPGVPAKTNPGMQEVPAPLLVTQSFGNDPVPGMTAKGNADLSKTLNIDNGDGTHSSTFSMSFGTDKGEVLVPGVGDGKTYPARQLRVLYTLPDGSQRWAVPGNQPHNWIAPERPTPQNNEALNQYQKTGKNFGTFEDEKAADAYGKTLHEDQEKYGRSGVTAHPVSPSGTIPAGPPVTVTKATWAQGQVQKLKDAAMQKAQHQASLLASGAPMSPLQEAMSKFRTDTIVQEAQVDESLKLAEKLGITGPALDEFKQQLAGLKTVIPKPLTGEAGKPYKGEDGLYYQSISNPDGSIGRRPMPPDWKPQVKAVRGTLLNTKQHGWIMTWVDPYDPKKIIGWQKTTPSRYYQGTTTTGSTTDPFGLTTTSSHTTAPTNTAPIDMDLSGMQELPSDFNGTEASSSPAASGKPAAPAAPKAPGTPSASKPAAAPSTPSQPAASARPSELKNRIPAPPQGSAPTAPLALDATGHIPANAPENPHLIEAANQLLDGMDVEKLPIPQKAREAAGAVARKYGWQGQGLFTPKEKLLLRESATYLDKAMTDPSMKVLDSKQSRVKIANAIHAAGDNSGMISQAIAVQFGLNPDENNFVSMYLQLIGTISGLGQLTRSNRMTEATAKRLMNELPNPLLTPNSKAGVDKLKRLRSEIDVATQKGSFDLSNNSEKNKAGGMTADEFLHKYPQAGKSSAPTSP